MEGADFGAGGGVGLLGEVRSDDGRLPGEDAIDLEELAGVVVAEGGFEVPEVEAFGAHVGGHLGHEDLAVVAVGAAVVGELAGIGAHVDDEVDM